MSESTDSSDSEQSAATGVLQSMTPEFVRRSFAVTFGLVLLRMALSIRAIGVAATQVITRDIRPLRELTGYAEEIEDGNLGVDIDQSRADEFGQLSALFSRIQEAEQAREEAEVAGAAEEQAAELTTVSHRANELRRYAEPLGDILDRFETE